MSSLDQLFPSRKRHPYYICAPPYIRTSAGIKVLHQLCHLLNLHGQSAFMNTLKVDPDLVTPVLTQQIVDQHYQKGRTPIIIYPEIVHANPLGGGCVVRYLLNLPGLLGGPCEFPDSDMLVWYHQGYRQAASGNGMILSIPATDARLYQPPASSIERHGSCVYRGKAETDSGVQLLDINKDSVEILRRGRGVQTTDQIVALFQHSEVFYCYESSALILEAILCGCPVILLPNKHMDKPLTFEPLGNAGMAWGTSPDELERAKRTVSEMPQRYNKWVEQAFNQLDDFIDKTQRKAENIAYSEKINLVDAFIPTALSRSKRNSLKSILKEFVPPVIWSVLRNPNNS
jgi:hypothetical protein